MRGWLAAGPPARQNTDRPTSSSSAAAALPAVPGCPSHLSTHVDPSLPSSCQPPSSHPPFSLCTYLFVCTNVPFFLPFPFFFFFFPISTAAAVKSTSSHLSSSFLCCCCYKDTCCIINVQQKKPRSFFNKAIYQQHQKNRQCCLPRARPKCFQVCLSLRRKKNADDECI